MSQLQGCCHGHVLTSEESDQSSGGSVCQAAIPRRDTQLFPLSCYESQSLKSDDYMDPPWAIPGRADRLVSTQSLTLDPIVLRRELAKMIILHEYPLSMVHHIGFKDFSSNLCPSFGMVSQETVQNDIMKICKFEKCNAFSDLGSSDNGRVAITMKMWISSGGNRKFVAITGHMINSQWKRQSIIMRFVNVPIVPTNESLVKVLLQCLSEFRVDAKLSTITVGNHSSDDELASMLLDKLPKEKLLLGGKLLRIPCFAHTLSLMVLDGFDVVSHVIEKIRDNIEFWTASREREEEFKKAACQSGVSTSVNLMLDYDSKWSSTYVMMQEAIKHKDIFVNLRQPESQCKSLPSEEEWSLASEVCQKLEILYQLVKILEEQPASCLYCQYLCHTKVVISKWRECGIAEIKEMAIKMLKKFDKYWSAARDVICIAAVFHPGLRMHAIKHFFRKIYGNEAEKEVERIRKILYDLYYEYKSLMPLDETKDKVQPLSKSANLHEQIMWLVREEERKEPEQCDLDSYLRPSHRQKIEDIYIITWWEKWMTGYPILRQIAKDILAIPIFSVDPEDLTHVGDRILCPNRSRLHPTMVETLMCTQSWLRSSRRSRSEVSSSLINKHFLGTIYDDANAEQGIIYSAKPAESDDISSGSNEL